jgi:G3E family GTPase
VVHGVSEKTLMAESTGQALVQTVLVMGPQASGKSDLLLRWARQSPPQEKWTLLFNGSTLPLGHLPENVHALQLAPGCLCCNSRLILNTHLGRTLRMRRPDRLFIEISHTSHPDKLLAFLQDPQWQPWLAKPKCVSVLPLSHVQNLLADNEAEAPWIDCADAVLVTGLAQADAVQAADALLALRRRGGTAQYRVNADVEAWQWGAAEAALGTGVRPL